MKITITALILLSILGCKTVIETSMEQHAENNIGFYYLPTGILKFQLLEIKKEDQTEYKLEYEILTLPDISQKYYLKYKQSSNSHDILNFEFDDNNFLKKIKIDTDDATDELIVKIADLATAYSKIKHIPSPGDLNELNTKEKIDTLCTLYYNTNENIKSVNNKLKKYNYKIKIGSLNKKKLANNSQNPDLIYRGIYYKPTIPYLIEIENIKTKKTQSFISYLPDNEIVKFDLSRAAFVKKVTELEFKNGQISKFSINKPSQTLEIVSVPIEILENIIALPTEMIQLKINLSSKNKDLYDAQKEEAETKKALEDLIKSLEDKKEEENENSGDPLK